MIRYLCCTILVALLVGCQATRHSLEGRALKSLALTTDDGRTTVRQGERIQLKLVATLHEGGSYTTGQLARQADFREFRLSTNAGRIGYEDGVLVIDNVSASMLQEGGVTVTAQPRWTSEPRADLQLSLDVSGDVTIDLQGANGKDGKSSHFGGRGTNGTNGGDGPKIDVHVSSLEASGKSYVRVQVLDRDEKQSSRLVIVDRGAAQVKILAGGGRGGHGGNGGKGRSGRNGKEDGERGGRGGSGGDGGNGGHGGRGGIAFVHADSYELAKQVTILVEGGAPGRAGRGGSGGPGGRGKNAANGSSGFSGRSGRRGNAGIDGGIEDVKK